jgi:hypothetical protein
MIFTSSLWGRLVNRSHAHPSFANTGSHSRYIVAVPSGEFNHGPLQSRILCSYDCKTLITDAVNGPRTVNVQMQVAKPFRTPGPQVPRTLSFVPASAPTTAPPTIHDLPLHLVGLVALAEAERGGEVACEHVNLLDVGQEGLVDGLLVRCPAGGDLLLL